jgi:hypothetical protein
MFTVRILKALTIGNFEVPMIEHFNSAHDRIFEAVTFESANGLFLN